MLSGQRAAARTLRAEGHASVDEAAVLFAAIAAQRRLLAEAQATSKVARRATARLPDRQSTAIEPQLPPAPDATRRIELRDRSHSIAISRLSLMQLTLQGDMNRPRTLWRAYYQNCQNSHGQGPSCELGAEI